MQYDIRMPSFDVNETTAVIADIMAENKQFVVTGQAVLLVENTKAVNRILVPHDGYVLVLCKKMETKAAGDRLAVVFETMEELEAFDADTQKDSGEDAKEESAAVNATRKAIELAKELNVDLAALARLKMDDVIKVKDVQDFFDKQHATARESSALVFQYDRERVVIVGAGKGAEVVIDILLDDYDKQIVGLVDDNVLKMQNYEFPILHCKIADFPAVIDKNSYDTVIISIGATLKSMQLRKEIFERYLAADIIFTNAIAKSAQIRRGVKIGTGNIIGADAYIGTLTRIGNNNSISYGTYIGHHNIIGSHNLLAPGLFTSGTVDIGDECIIPAGVVVRNCVHIGSRVIVPVGYAIVNSIEDNTIIRQQY